MVGLYNSILPYQTRLLHLPHQPSASDPDVIECSLHVADLLHQHFGGFGLRSNHGTDDSFVMFNALSYAWGSQEKTTLIRFNSLDIAITDSLYQALLSIRTGKYASEFFWIDALCIDQSNDNEKAVQVSHMLQIYEQASLVIGWLGLPKDSIRFQMVSHDNHNLIKVDGPSWVIDWRLVSRYCSEIKTDESRMVRLANPWHFDVRETPWGSLSPLDRSYRSKRYREGIRHPNGQLLPGPRTGYHELFCKANRHIAQSDPTKLTLYDWNVRDFRVDRMSGYVSAVLTSMHGDLWTRWRLPEVLEDGDIFVVLDDFARYDYAHHEERDHDLS